MTQSLLMKTNEMKQNSLTIKAAFQKRVFFLITLCKYAKDKGKKRIESSHTHVSMILNVENPFYPTN